MIKKILWFVGGVISTMVVCTVWLWYHAVFNKKVGESYRDLINQLQ